MPARATSTSRCPGPATGSGSSVTVSTSGPPNSVIWIARMTLHFGAWRPRVGRAGSARAGDAAELERLGRAARDDVPRLAGAVGLQDPHERLDDVAHLQDGEAALLQLLLHPAEDRGVGERRAQRVHPDALGQVGGAERAD